MSVQTQASDFWQRTGLFNADIVSMSIFRICFAVYLATTTAEISVFFKEAYTDEGILPRSVLISRWPGAENLSLLTLNNTPLFYNLFIATAIIAVVAFGVGYRTRLATVTLAIISISLYWRNPLVVSHIQLLRSLLLIWGAFLPLNCYFSVDSILDPTLRTRKFTTIPVLAMKLQICSIYFFSALYKLAGHSWTDGTAVQHVLEGRIYGQRSVGLWLVESAPIFLHYITYAIVIFQIMFSLLIYCPYRNTMIRALALSCAVAMHLSFLFFLNIGYFPQLCLCYLILLVPDAWWKLLGRWFNALLSVIETYSRIRLTLLCTVWQRWATKFQSQPTAPVSRGIVAEIFCVFLAMLALSSNIIQTPEPYFLTHAVMDTNHPTSGIAGELLNLAEFFQVKQQWGIFAPEPSDIQLALTLSAHVQEGQDVDLSARIPGGMYWLNKKMQPVIPGQWKRYLIRLAHSERHEERNAFAQYLCRKMRESHSFVGGVPQSLALKMYILPSTIQWSQQVMLATVPKINESYTCQASSNE